MKIIPVKIRNFRASVPAFIDDQDHDFLSAFVWYVDPGTSTLYARKMESRRKGGSWKTKSVSMHRLIVNAPRGKDVDHINGNGLDNRRANLRICSRKENLGNQRVRTNNTSGFKGVYWHNRAKKWCAQITENEHGRHQGLFQTKEEAARAYDLAAKNLYGDFAKLNFPT